MTMEVRLLIFIGMFLGLALVGLVGSHMVKRKTLNHLKDSLVEIETNSLEGEK